MNLNVNWKSHITNEELYCDVGLLPIYERLRTVEGSGLLVTVPGVSQR